MIASLIHQKNPAKAAKIFTELGALQVPMAYFNAGMLTGAVGNYTEAANLVLEEMKRATLDPSELSKSHVLYQDLVAKVDDIEGKNAAKKLIRRAKKVDADYADELSTKLLDGLLVPPTPMGSAVNDEL